MKPVSAKIFLAFQNSSPALSFNAPKTKKEGEKLCEKYSKNPEIKAVCDFSAEQKTKRFYHAENYLNGVRAFQIANPSVKALRSEYCDKNLKLQMNENNAKFMLRQKTYDDPTSQNLKSMLAMTTGAALGFAGGLYAAHKFRAPVMFIGGTLLGAGLSYGVTAYHYARKNQALRTEEGMRQTTEQALAEDDAEADASLFNSINSLLQK